MFTRKSIAIVLNSPSPLADIEENDLLCADGGYSRVVGAEKNIIVLGDFDSLNIPDGVKTVICPTDKDYTDGEKAVRYAAENGAETITLYGADGGRMDMQYSNLSLLKIAYDLGLKGKIKTTKENIFYTEKEFCRTVNEGCTVSVLPYGGSVTFRGSEGLHYPLQNLTLTPADTVGVSNKAVAKEIKISVKSGGCFIFIS